MGDTAGQRNAAARRMGSGGAAGTVAGDGVVASRLDLASPRVRAAMRVLGITVADLGGSSVPGTYKAASTPRAAPSPSAATRRAEVFERKRRETLAQLEATVDLLGEEDTQRILAPRPLTDMREVMKAPQGVVARQLDKSQEQIEALRHRAKADVDRYVNDQRTVLKKLDKGQAKKEKTEQHLKEHREAEQLKINERSKRMQGRVDRRKEAIMKERQEQREQAKEAHAKLDESTEKAQQLRQERTETDSRTRKDRHYQHENTVERNKEESLLAQEELLRQYLEKEQHLLQRRGAGRREKAKPSPALTDATTTAEVPPSPAEDRQAKREAAFKKKSDDLRKADVTVKQMNEERSQAIRDGIAKRMQKKDDRVQQVRKNRYERRKQILEKLESRDPESVKEALTEETHHRMEQREIMDDIVARNQQCNDRVNEFAREQMLLRIQQNSAKSDALAELRRQHQLQRTQILREQMLERCNAEEMVRTMKKLPQPEEPPPAEENK